MAKKRGVGRLTQILKICFKWGVSGYFNKKHEKKLITPSRIRRLFEELGGIFVKLGQFLSLRPDLIPAKFCKELEKLQDNVEVFPFKEAKAIIEKELGQKFEDIFEEFNQKPIAAASIGQVYKAKLLSGEIVAVKVMRPGIDRIVLTDLRILKSIAKKADKLIDQNVLDPVEIVDELERYTRRELNYLEEAHNLEVFQHHFSDDDRITVPKVYRAWTSQKVLTMQFIHGFPAHDRKRLARHNRKKIAYTVVESMMRQVLELQRFHADPHPGNIFVLPHDNVAFLDFGIVGMLHEDYAAHLEDLFLALLNANPKAISKSMIALNIADREVNLHMLEEDVSRVLGKYHKTSLKRVHFGLLLAESLDAARRNNIRVPRELVLLGKALATLQGFVIEVYPEFDITECIKEYLSKRRKLTFKLIRKKLFKDLDMFKSVVPTIKKIFFDIDDADKNLKRLEFDLKLLDDRLLHSGERIMTAIVAVGLLLFSAIALNVENSNLFNTGGFISFLVALFLLLKLLFHYNTR